jgi:hypothetical protein
MRHYARPLRATLTTLVMLLAMAGAAGAEDTTNADCPLDDCPRPPSSPGLGSAAGMPKSADKAKTLTRHTQSVAPESAARRFSIEISSCALTRRTCSQ